MINQGLDEFVGLAVKIVGIVRSDRLVIPDETLDVKVFAIDLEFPAFSSLFVVTVSAAACAWPVSAKSIKLAAIKTPPIFFAEATQLNFAITPPLGFYV